MINPQKLVEDFHKSFGHPVKSRPQGIPRARLEKRITWMMEELGKLVAAEDFISQLDALADLLYFIYGTFVEMGVDSSAIFRIVHEANMLKSKGEFRHGKTSKPDNWIPPEVKIYEYIANERLCKR